MRRRVCINIIGGIVNLSQISVWSKNSSSFPVSNKRKFFNADEFIKGSGQDDAAQGASHNSQGKRHPPHDWFRGDTCLMRCELEENLTDSSVLLPQVLRSNSHLLWCVTWVL